MTTQVIEAWNDLVVPYTRCRSIKKLSPRLKQLIDVSVSDIGIDSWIESLDRLWTLRGLTETKRFSIAKLIEYDKKGISLIERIGLGECDRWLAPTRGELEPTLSDIVDRGATPSDWLYPPPDVFYEPDRLRCVYYCVRMLDHSPYMKNWLAKRYKEPPSDILWDQMKGLLNPLLIERFWQWKQGKDDENQSQYQG